MPIKSRIDLETGLVFHVADGILVMEELLAAFDTVASDPLFQSDMNVLWDVTGATIEGGGTDEIQALAAAIGRRLDHDGRHKVAIAAPQDLAYGLARMYEAYAGQLPIELNVFRSREKALQWLKGKSTT